MKRTIDNCSLVKEAIKQMIGSPDIIDGKCMGYSSEPDADGDDDESCETCKKCKLNNTYGE